MGRKIYESGEMRPLACTIFLPDSSPSSGTGNSWIRRNSVLSMQPGSNLKCKWTLYLYVISLWDMVFIKEKGHKVFCFPSHKNNFPSPCFTNWSNFCHLGHHLVGGENMYENMYPNMDSCSDSAMFLWLVSRVHCWGGVSQLAAIPVLTTYTPSISRPPSLGAKVSRKRRPWQYASASHQLSASKLGVIASALFRPTHFRHPLLSRSHQPSWGEAGS
jgi:hypothetical protein